MTVISWQGTDWLRWLVAGALLADAIGGWLLYRAMSEGTGDENQRLAIALALLVVATAVLVVVQPRPLVLTFARGIAAMAGWCVILFLILVAFGSLFNPGRGTGWELPVLVPALALQVAILVGTRRMDGAGVAKLLTSTAAGLMLVILAVVVVYVAVQIASLG